MGRNREGRATSGKAVDVRLSLKNSFAANITAFASFQLLSGDFENKPLQPG
jgi:hypothetical protein